MKRISLEQLLKPYHNENYAGQYRRIRGLLDSGRIRPVKASGTNGKTPALYREYWLMEEQKNYEELREELMYQLVPLLSVDYYLNHLSIYEQDRKWVLLLNTYLKERRELLEHQESVNERSFEIWNREKFLSREQGKKILKRCGLDITLLNYYRTTEPIAYYCATRQTPQKLLIIENKDTFYSMRKRLTECQSLKSIFGQSMSGEGLNDAADDAPCTICGEQIGTLIYGAGKGILAAFSDFDSSGEPYMTAQGNTVLYFGDLDYEGIGIYENFASAFGAHYLISVFRNAYERMLAKAEHIGIEKLPVTKEGQNRKIGSLFLSQFSQPQQDKIREILESGRYIPQEILNIQDMA